MTTGLKQKIKIIAGSTVASLAAPLLTKAAGEVQAGLGSLQSLFPIGGLSSATTVGGLIYAVIQLMLTLAGAIAVLFVIIGGFWYITSAGNAELAEKGKTTLVNAIIGVVIIVLSYVIINVIVNTVSRSNGVLGF
jgi:hypothetical protein